MSDKEYKVEAHGDYITVTEVEPCYIDYETDPNPTLRERMGKKIRGTKKSTKIYLTLLFNIYGIFYRLGTNRTLSVFFGFLHFNLLLSVMITWGVFLTDSAGEETYILVMINLRALFIQIIDLISIVLSGDIVFLKMKKYKNYSERKKFK